MKAGSAAASIRSYFRGPIGGAVTVAAVVAALLIAPAAAFASGNGQGNQEPWISLASVNGSAPTVQPSLGSTVAFATGYAKNVQNPRIEVLCYQNGSLVYGEAGGVSDTFLLGGGGSIWMSTGGSATCIANLFYFGQHAGSQTYNFLATTDFSAGG